MNISHINFCVAQNARKRTELQFRASWITGSREIQCYTY